MLPRPDDGLPPIFRGVCPALPPFLVLEKAISSTSYEIDIGGAFFYIYFPGLDLPMLLVSPTTQSHGQASD